MQGGQQGPPRSAGRQRLRILPVQAAAPAGEERKRSLTQKVYERSLKALYKLPPGLSPHNPGKMARRMALFYTPVVHVARLIGGLFRAAGKGASSAAGAVRKIYAVPAKAKQRPVKEKPPMKEKKPSREPSAPELYLEKVSKQLHERTIPHLEKLQNRIAEASKKEGDAEVVKDAVRRLVARAQRFASGVEKRQQAVKAAMTAGPADLTARFKTLSDRLAKTQRIASSMARIAEGGKKE